MENVRILLQTLNDIYPGPTTIRQTHTSGPAPSRRAPCRLCNPSSGKPRPTIASCPGCDGDGWRKRRPGDPQWDEYTGSVIATSEQPKKAVPMTPARLEAELARVETDLRLREGGVDPNESYGWERERKLRDAEASYPELERVLDVMQIEWPVGRSTVTSLYFTGLPRPPSAAWERLDHQVVSWIAERMRGRIRIPRRFWEAQQEQRKATIRQLAKQGWDERDIAREVGCSRRFTRTVLAGTINSTAGAVVNSHPSDPGA